MGFILVRFTFCRCFCCPSFFFNLCIHRIILITFCLALQYCFTYRHIVFIHFLSSFQFPLLFANWWWNCFVDWKCADIFTLLQASKTPRLEAKFSCGRGWWQGIPCNYQLPAFYSSNNSASKDIKHVYEECNHFIYKKMTLRNWCNDLVNF